MSAFKKIRDSTLSKLTLVHLAIVILIVPLSSYLMYVRYDRELVDKQKQINNTILTLVGTQFNNMVNSSYKAYQMLFEKEFSYELIKFCKNTEEDYFAGKPFLQQYFSSRLSNIFIVDENIVSFSFYIENTGTLYLYDKDYKTISIRTGYEETIGRMQASGQERIDFFTYHASRPISPSIKNRYLGIRYLIFETGSNRVLAKVSINYDTNKFDNLISGTMGTVKGPVFLVNDNGTILYDSTNDHYGESISDIMGTFDNGDLYADGMYLVSRVELPNGGLELFALTPLDEITSVSNAVRRIAIVVTLAAVIFIVIIYTFFARIFARRMRRLISSMEMLSQGNYDTHISVSGSNDEISRISRTFNGMCDKMMRSIDNLLAAQEKQKQAELQSLQAKIDPHFLFNSLEIIRMKASELDCFEVEEMLQIFSELFRNTVNSVSFCSVGEEIEQLRIYTEIIQMCYCNSLTISYEINDNIIGHYMLTKLLQPIAENYIVHGYDRKRDDNELHIKALENDGDIVFVITDNGRGIPADRVLEIQKSLTHVRTSNSKNIGLANVNDRLKLIFGDKYGVEIESVENERTCVVIRTKKCTKQEIAGLLRYKAASEEMDV